jgi:ribosomal protein S18 acetylase RimI-like enzyme
MNFYSDVITNDIIDNEPLETVLDSIETFGEECFNAIAKYSHHNIHPKYIFNVLGNTKNIIAFHCIDNDNDFSLKNCPSMLVYRKCKCICKQHNDDDDDDDDTNEDNVEIRYYVLIACTKRKFRNQGYASKLLDGFIERIKKENEGNQSDERSIKIILSSVEESVLFYEAYGFKWTRESITDHPLLMRFERYEPKKEYFIMEFHIHL